MPRCADDKWYNTATRPRVRLTEPVVVQGKNTPRVSSNREAYGLIQFENSRESWLAKFEWDDEQEKIFKDTGARRKQCPNYTKKNEKETEKFKCKWSDFAQGSTSKWDPCVYTELELRIEKVRKWRKEDAQVRNYKGQDFAMKLSQEKQGLTQDDLQPKAAKTKKCSRANMDVDNGSEATTQPKYFGYRDEVCY